MSREETLELLNQVCGEQAQFEAFCYGMRSAFNHRGRFDDFEDFETWLYNEWDDYREVRI